MRISATTLESFRLYLTTDWLAEEELIASIKREFVPTDRVKLGQAFHAVIETPERYRVEAGFRCNGYDFALDVMQPVLDTIDRRGVCEVKATTDLDGHTLVCRADQLVGAHIYEWKCTTGGFDPDKYLDSVQWRVMALAFEPLAVTYRVACLGQDSVGVLSLKGLEHVTCYPYAALRQDVSAVLHEFVAYVRLRRLESYLQQPSVPDLFRETFEDSPTRSQLRA